MISKAENSTQLLSGESLNMRRKRKEVGGGGEGREDYSAIELKQHYCIQQHEA